MTFTGSHCDLVFERGATCEETQGMIGNDYIRCGAPAEAVVLSERGRRLYFMCPACAVHNVNHRDAIAVMAKTREMAETLGL